MNGLVKELKSMSVTSLTKVFGKYIVRKITTRSYILYRVSDGMYVGHFVGAELVARKISNI